MKFNFLKKAAAFVTAAAMAVGTLAVLPEECLPEFGIVASAAENTVVYNCGTNVKATITGTKMVFSGTGAMDGYSHYNNVPWKSYQNIITEVIFEDGITSIGMNACCNFSKLYSVTISDSVKSMGQYAFHGCSSLLSVKIPCNPQKYAFTLCTNLREIQLTENVTSLGSYTFSECGKISRIVCSNSLTYIASDAFLQDKNYTIYGYEGSYAQNFAETNGVPFVAYDSTSYVPLKSLYEIYTASDLMAINNYPYGNYRLMNNIDMSSYGDWTPLCQDAPFTGTFDGNGYTLKNLSINTDQVINSALFSCISGGTVKNLGLENVDINSTYTSSDTEWPNSAGITGGLESSGKIEQCYVTGKITANNTNNSGCRVAGLVGYTGSGATINNCYADVELSGTAEGANTMVAGIVAWLNSGSSVNNSYAAGTIYAKNSGYCYAGGIAASGDNGTINRSVALQDSINATATNVANNVICEFASCYDCSYLSGIAGNVSTERWYNNMFHFVYGSYGVISSQADAKTQATYTKLGWNFSSIWKMPDDGYPVFKWVVSGNLPLTDEQKTQMTEFINQHYYSSQRPYWNDYHEVKDTMKDYDSSAWSEASHSAVIVLDVANDIVDPDVEGIQKSISANAYNSILLDMYYDIEFGSDFDEITSKNIGKKVADKIHESIKPYLTLLSKSSKTGKNYLQLIQGEDLYNFENDIYKFCSGKSNKSWEEIIRSYCGDDLDFDKLNSINIKEIEDYCNKESGAGEFFTQLDNITTGINTAFDLYENFFKIIEAQVLRDMDDEYREILTEIQNKISTHTVDGTIESKDLQTDLWTAIEYEKTYHKYYWAHDIWISIKSGSSVVFEYLKCDVPGFKTPTDKINDLLKKPLEKQVDKMFGAGTFAAVGFGYSTGWFLSDKMFNLTESNDLYYKGKAYGFLEDILQDVLNEKAANLSLIEDGKNYSDEQIKDLHHKAVLYDIAFKMYRFTESDGCKTFSNYEKSFITATKDEGLFKAFLQTLGDEVELAVRFLFHSLEDIGTVVINLVTGQEMKAEELNPLYESLNEMEKIYLTRTANALYYQKRSEFILNLKCHGNEFNSAESSKSYVDNINAKWEEMRLSDSNIAVIMCPVEVNVYDENQNCLGTISSNKNTIENNTRILACRNEENDANIIIYPTNYKIEIIGLDNGEMNIIAGHYSNMAIDRIANYAGITVNDEYVGEFIINGDDDHLISNNSRLSNILVDLTEISDFSADNTIYNVPLPSGTTAIPTVTATPANVNADVDITQATSLTGTESERTATITVTAEDGVTKTIYKVIFSIEPHTHNLATDYSSDETGHWYECSDCDDKVDFESHTEDSGTVTTEPTETTEGVKTFKCTKCDWVIRTEPIAVLDHTHTLATEYSFDATGHWYTCSGCDEKVDFEAHTEDSGTVTTEPTETTEGVKTFKCTKCDWVIRTEPIAVLDHTHTLSTEYSSDATGHWYACSSCDEKVDFETHTEDSGTVTTEPTETTEGVKTFKCAKCGWVIRTEPIAVLDHTHTLATEYSSDATGHWYACSGCDEKVAFEAHTEDSGTVTTEPTETSEGIKTFKCVKCEYVMRTETIPTITPEHTHEYSTEWKSDSRSHWHECSCGDKSNIGQHISNGGIVTVQPTATSTGLRVYSCSICGYVLSTETIPATGNNYPSYPTYPTYPTYPFDSSIFNVVTFTDKVNVTAETEGNTVTIKWDKVEKADKYYVYQYKNGKYVKVKTTSDTSATFKKLKNGETYKFLVRYTKSGRLSPTKYSGTISVKIYNKPIPKPTATKNSIKLTWEAVPEAEKYAVYKYVDGKAIKLTETKKLSVKIGKLIPDTEYKYIVRAYVDGKWTTMLKSDIVTVKTKAE